VECVLWVVFIACGMCFGWRNCVVGAVATCGAVLSPGIGLKKKKVLKESFG